MSQIVAASPHVTTKNSTAVIMRDVLIALLPAVIAGCVVFGLRALLVVAVTTAACIFFEWGFEKLCDKPSTISDLSAAVTGVLLAMNLPVSIPLWQAVFGALVAMVAVKGLFGGIGKNFANPAITARIVSVPRVLEDHDGVGFPGRGVERDASCDDGKRRVSRLPDAAARKPRRLPWRDERAGASHRLCLSSHPGRDLLAYAGLLRGYGVSLLTALVLGQDRRGAGPLPAACCWARSSWRPITPPHRLTDRGQSTYAVSAAGLHHRCSSASTATYPEGVSFAILFMNILTPYLSKWTETKPFGGAAA